MRPKKRLCGIIYVDHVTISYFIWCWHFISDFLTLPPQTRFWASVTSTVWVTVTQNNIFGWRAVSPTEKICMLPMMINVGLSNNVDSRKSSPTSFSNFGVRCSLENANINARFMMSGFDECISTNFQVHLINQNLIFWFRLKYILFVRWRSLLGHENNAI